MSKCIPTGDYFIKSTLTETYAGQVPKEEPYKYNPIVVLAAGVRAPFVSWLSFLRITVVLIHGIKFFIDCLSGPEYLYKIRIENRIAGEHEGKVVSELTGVPDPSFDTIWTIRPLGTLRNDRFM